MQILQSRYSNFHCNKYFIYELWIGTATRSTAKLEKDSNAAVEAAEKAELRRAEAEAIVTELKRKLVLLQEDNRRLESQIDQQKVMQIESDREKLQIEAKLRESEFKQEAIQVNN